MFKNICLVAIIAMLTLMALTAPGDLAAKSDITAFQRDTMVCALDLNGATAGTGYEVMFQASATTPVIIVGTGTTLTCATNADVTKIKNATVTLADYAATDEILVSSVNSKFHTEIETGETDLVLTISNEGTLAEYVTALKALRFYNGSCGRDTGTVTLTTKVNTGPDSNVCTTSVYVY